MKMNRKFSQTLSGYQKQINKEIDKFFNKKINQTEQPFLKEILRLLREFSLRPAGRIRAVLVNYGYFLAGGKNKKAILETSIFIELIHNYFLIHDDIIDRDKIRRDGPTIHSWYQKLSALNGKEKEHHGQSMGIVAGDIIASLGYEIVASSNFPAPFKVRALEKLNQVVYLTCYGQMLELWLREKIKFKKRINEDDIFEIYRNKTASYSFIGSLQIGAILVSAKEDFLKKIEKFALPLGIAFQIKDDISDVKSDTKEGQPTLIEKSGSIQYCQKTAEKLINQAKNNLNSEKKFPNKEKQFLLSLADYILLK